MPTAWRFRCHGRRIETGHYCPRAAKWWAPDPDRADAATFYCELHRPIDAKRIADDRPFVDVEVAFTVRVGGSTTALADARAAAISRVTDLLRMAGMTVDLVGSAASVAACGYARRLEPLADRQNRPERDEG